ncbi:SpoIIE family protein phosphatase [Kitasatospora phosalacinea]|uniref:SpoIIE family protein phosphatase n=1 Tax=Kitasatospora phosalacinea TaxID=2065 RepID=UPI00364BC3AE
MRRLVVPALAERYRVLPFGYVGSGGSDLAARDERRIASGGHPPGVLLRADGSSGFLPTPGGLPVGVLPEAPFTTATADGAGPRERTRPRALRRGCAVPGARRPGGSSPAGPSRRRCGITPGRGRCPLSGGRRP